MQRREMLKLAVSTAAGVGMFVGVGGAVEGRKGEARPRGAEPPCLPARDGTSLFFRDWGAGKPVVFVHGWGLHSAFWEYQMTFLATQGFRCIAYDRRSHGRSADPGRGYDFDTLADDLDVIVAGLDLRNVTLVGHSMGGAEIVRYLSRHGSGRVARAIFVGATLPFILQTPDNPEGVPKRAFDRLREVLSTDRPKWLADNSAPFWTPTTSPAMMDWGHTMPFECSLRAMVELTRAMSETDFRAELRGLTIPVLVVHGTEDQSVPVKFGRATARLLRNGQIKEYEGAPHGLALTHMERFNRDLLEFAKS